MFKWLLKKWKIWRLNRKRYEVIWASGKDKYFMKHVCFGSMKQYMSYKHGIRRNLRRLDDGVWATFNDDEGDVIISSKEVEQAYQKYLDELSELTLL